MRIEGNGFGDIRNAHPFFFHLLDNLQLSLFHFKLLSWEKYNT